MNALLLEPPKLGLLSKAHGASTGGQHQVVRCEDPLLTLLDNLECVLASGSTASSSELWQDVITSFQQVRRLLREQSLKAQETAVCCCLRKTSQTHLDALRTNQTWIGVVNYSHAHGEEPSHAPESLWDCPLNDY